MLRSPQDAHLRSLIDQRNANAHIAGRVSAVSVDDSPSIYSHSQCSPQPSDYSNGHAFFSPFSLTRPSNSALQDSNKSMLDLDDDTHSSILTPDPEDDEDTHENGDPATRMSYLGPKMRFHSRAPWELDSGTLDEVEENPRQLTSGFPFGRAKRTHGSDSSSPRPSYDTGRKSGESSWSIIAPKRSFETVNSQVAPHPRGALYTLAQESLSSTSLARPKQQLKSKFSLARLKSEPAVPTPSPAVPRYMLSSPVHDQPPHSFDHSRSPSIQSYATSIEPSGPSDSFHPYANPDLVSSYADTASLSSFSMRHNDSSVTVTDISTLDSFSKLGPRSTLSPDTSFGSLAPAKPRHSPVNLKNISSPIAVVRPPDPLGPSPAVWNESPMPTFSLISLEEARAQRLRSATANAASRISTASTETSSTAFPPNDETTDLSPVTTRSRGRSISAGSKAKNALHQIVGAPKTERRDSEPMVSSNGSGGSQPKGLKHKKSGFMRLFNGGKAQEKDGRESPPPVPHLPDTYQATQRTPVPHYRVPVPSVTPSLLGSIDYPSNDSLDTSESYAKVDLPTSMRRGAPYLSINTDHHGNVPPALGSSPSSGNSSERFNLGKATSPTTLGRPYQNEQPRSAPANVTEFPALKLRPVSALFSTHFANIGIPASRSSDETEPPTPDSPLPSPNVLVTPLTPNSLPRMSNEQPVIVAGGDDLRTLQDQMASTRKAYQKQIQNLEDQVRDLTSQLEMFKGKGGNEYCSACGRGEREGPSHVSVLHRPRARTGANSRFTNAMP